MDDNPHPMHLYRLTFAIWADAVQNGATQREQRSLWALVNDALDRAEGTKRGAHQTRRTENPEMTNRTYSATEVEDAVIAVLDLTAVQGEAITYEEGSGLTPLDVSSRVLEALEDLDNPTE